MRSQKTIHFRSFRVVFFVSWFLLFCLLENFFCHLINIFLLLLLLFFLWRGLFRVLRGVKEIADHRSNFGKHTLIISILLFFIFFKVTNCLLFRDICLLWIILIFLRSYLERLVGFFPLLQVFFEIFHKLNSKGRWGSWIVLYIFLCVIRVEFFE